MLNKDLFDSKDAEIANLRKVISEFQKYDIERKNYYSKALQELGELRSYVEELEDTDKRAKKLKELNGRIKNLQKEVNKLNSVIIHNNFEIPTDNNTWIRYSIERDNYELRKQNKALNKKNAKLAKTNKELINRICELANKLRKYEDKIDSN